MIVVKLGGSLYHSPHLKHWLDTLVSISNQHSVIIVPGGGPFADNVRSAQITHHFDDSTAHHMAILAMAQFGLLLRGVCRECYLFRYNNSNSLPNPLSVWIPDESLLSETEIPHSWDISSDSLALWLAHKLNAQALILVKSCDIPNHASIPQLIEQGIIDHGFERLYQSSPLKLHLFNAANYQRLANILATWL